MASLESHRYERSGGDVNDIIGPLFERDHDGLLEFTRMTCDLILAIRECRRPVIAALNGTTAGAGAVIASACDVRIASESAKIAFLFTKVGLCGADMGIAWLLPRFRYVTNLKPIGEAYRKRMGRHYPAMALVEVKALMESNALIEVEATAVLPS